MTRELEVAIDAATRAATAVMDVYASEFRVSYKDKEQDDPVTAADREANAIIVARLREEFPDDTIVAEESAVPQGFERAKRCWFVDPLDGTKEFVARNGEFCVMIGLAIDGRAKLGAIAIPALEGGFVLAGEIGEGAVRIDAHGRTPQRVTTLADPSKATVVVSRSRRSKRLDVFLRELGGPRELACGSVGVKIGKLLSGEAHAYLHPPALGESGAKRWDVCAPEAILVAAGGAFTDVQGASTDYASPDLIVRGGIVASNGVLHPALLSAIARVRAAGNP